MRTFRIVLSLAVLLAISGVANAYRINVLDPYSTNQIYSQPFSVTLLRCQQGQLPKNAAPTGTDGCFTGQNETSGIITTLEIVFPDAGVLAGASLDCSKSSGSLFTASSCGTYNGQQVFNFSGLNIVIGESFLIYEQGIDPGPTHYDADGNPSSSFPVAQGSFPPAVPEPSSIYLLSTGLAYIGASPLRRRWTARNSAARQ